MNATISQPQPTVAVMSLKLNVTLSKLLDVDQKTAAGGETRRAMAAGADRERPGYAPKSLLFTIVCASARVLLDEDHRGNGSKTGL